MASLSARVSSPQAMARPRCSPIERELLPQAARELKARGSLSAQAKAVASEVARIALLDVMATDDDTAMRIDLARAKMENPAIAALATMPEVDTAAIIMAEAVRQFEARGCRHLPPDQWERANAALRDAVTKRLAGRYRRRMK